MSLPVVLQRVAALGYKVFSGSDYDLNIVGIRSASQAPNLFDDLLTISYQLKGQWFTRSWDFTSDPGLYWLRNPGRRAGTAILCPGQYPGMWALGKHRGSYTALVQVGKARFFRDNDRDSELDMDPETIEESIIGANLHRASRVRKSTQVDRWSAACQVVADGTPGGDYDQLIRLAKRQVEAHPTWKRYTYTLLEEW